MYPRRHAKTRKKTRLPSALYNQTLLAHKGLAGPEGVKAAAPLEVTPNAAAAVPVEAPKEADTVGPGPSVVPPPPPSTSIEKKKEEEEEPLLFGIDAPRHVTKQGLTLQQLYQLKRDADAWNLMEQKRMREHAERNKALRAQQLADKKALSQFYDRQVEEKHAQEQREEADVRAWAEELQQAAQAQQAADAAKALAETLRKTQYRADFCEDMARLEQLSARQRQKQLAAEQAELDHLRRLEADQARKLQQQKQDNLARMKHIQLEFKQQMLDRAQRKKEEAEEIIRLDREWVAAQDKKDRERHAAFRKIVARQEATAASFTLTTQEALKRQLEDDERRALKYQADHKAALEADDERRKQKRQAATRAQVTALELEMRLQAERKQLLKAEEQAMAQEMLARDKAAWEKEEAKKAAARAQAQEHKRLLAAQMVEQQQNNQRIIVGFVQPSEMTLNKSLFAEIGYVSPDPKAPPVQYLGAYGHAKEGETKTTAAAF